MINPLDLIFLRLTESGTEQQIRIKANLIGAVQSNNRGSTDVYTELLSEGDSKVFVVLETPEEIFEAMRNGYLENVGGKK